MGQFDRLVRGARGGEEFPRKDFERSEGKVRPPKPKSARKKGLAAAPLRDDSGGVGERDDEFGDEVNKNIISSEAQESSSTGDLSLSRLAKVRRFSE